jgi:hypothetical protein
MSQCNYCTLREIKRENKGKQVTLVPDNGWLRVMIDGKDGGHLFMAITEHCVC